MPQLHAAGLVAGDAAPGGKESVLHWLATLKKRFKGVNHSEPLLLLLHAVLPPPTPSGAGHGSAFVHPPAAPAASRRLLRHCGRSEGCEPCSACGEETGRGARLRFLERLDICACSPLAAALLSDRKGSFERALVLYNASICAGGPPTTPSAAARTAAEVRRDLLACEWPARTRQLVALWWSRTALPEAGAEAQLAAAAEAWAAQTPPPGQSVSDPAFISRFEFRDPEEQIVEVDGKVMTVTYKGDQPLPPFIYMTESAPYDMPPQFLRLPSGCTHGCSQLPARGCGKTRAPGEVWGKHPCCRVGSRMDLKNPCSCGASECTIACACAEHPKKCENRASQQGVTVRLCVTRYADKGWGVKTLKALKRGDFVCEYVGELISESEMKAREERAEINSSYIFTPSGRGGAEAYAAIDGFAMRNVAAFINFSCSPNLELRYLDHPYGDRRIKRVGFYAKEDIESGTELGYRRNQGCVDGQMSKIACKCGSEKCRGFL